MAADKNDEIESEDTEKQFLQLQKWIDLLAEKANIMITGQESSSAT